MSHLGELDAHELDPLLGTGLHERLPGLRTALDGPAMAALLPEALSLQGPLRGCEVRQASFLGDSCLVRYAVELDGWSTVVTGLVFPDDESCLAYVAERLEPLLNPPLPPMRRVGALVGRVPELNLALSMFPIDGGLPTLVAANDVRLMLAHLRASVPRTYGEPLDVTNCSIELGHYGRQHRCVLRYRLDIDGRDGLEVYGKVAADDRGEVAALAARALRQRAGSFGIPRVLDYLPSLRLGLFEGLPGRPRVSELVRSRLRGVPGQSQQPPSLESALDACAGIAALIHCSGIDAGPDRPFEVEAANLRSGFALIRTVAPRLADGLEAVLSKAEAAEAGEAAPLVLGHGDFSYTQLIFDGDRAGLVDFDTICRAEPALDLGHFLAYLELAGRKADASGATVLTQMRDHFMAAYASARGLTDLAQLTERTRHYQTVSLLRLAAHSWQKLKPNRLRHVLEALDRHAAPATGARS